ncbi:MAG: hypothetical protein WDO69_15295 [Pseudomonadota bacterium]
MWPRVRRRRWSTLYFDQAVLFGTTTTTSATVTGLLPGTHYNFYVRSMRSAIGGDGFVGEPVEIGATTPGPEQRIARRV